METRKSAEATAPTHKKRRPDKQQQQQQQQQQQSFNIQNKWTITISNQSIITSGRSQSIRIFLNARSLGSTSKENGGQFDFFCVALFIAVFAYWRKGVDREDHHRCNV